jgi:hypothetical protein
MPSTYTMATKRSMVYSATSSTTMPIIIFIAIVKFY